MVPLTGLTTWTSWTGGNTSEISICPTSRTIAYLATIITAPSLWFKAPRPANDPLLHIHRIRDVDYYYRGDSCLDAPFILAPSNVKFVYAQPLLDLWSGWGGAGAYNLGISVIGFSLPKHDDYVRIMLYQMINNYQQCLWGEKMLGVLKDNVKLVDYRRSDKDIAAYKERYSFVDSARARYMFGGLSHKAIQFIFDQTRY